MTKSNLVAELIPSAKFLPTSKLISLREWTERTGIVLRGRPYNTEQHEYLDQILDDTHPNQTFEKAAQVCISTTILLKSLWVADLMGKKVVYYFQDDVAVSDFSADRAEPIISQNMYLSERVRETNRVGLRQLGAGSIFFRGLFSRGKAKSVDADMVVLDELDEARPSHVEYATDRLGHSELGWVFALSQPSVPGFGIDRRFVQTDQHYWHLICPKCGKYNCLEVDFPENFPEIPAKLRKTFPAGATHYTACKYCWAELNPAHGEWVAKHPGRLLRGYHLSRLYSQVFPPEVPNMATQIMAEYALKRLSQLGMENFTVSFLGFPFAGGHARVNDALLDSCEADYRTAFSGSDCFIGVDQGDTLTIAVGEVHGEEFRFIHFEETERWDRLPFLMRQFGARYCVIDAQPNKDSAKRFAIAHPKRVSIQYFGSKETKTGEEPYEGRIMVPTVSVDRTETLDWMIDSMESGHLKLPARRGLTGRALEAVENARRHFKQLITKNEVNRQGIMRKVYLRGDAVENHYGMAASNALIAAYHLGIRPSGPMVLPEFRKAGRYRG